MNLNYIDTRYVLVNTPLLLMPLTPFLEKKKIATHHCYYSNRSPFIDAFQILLKQ